MYVWDWPSRLPVQEEGGGKAKQMFLSFREKYGKSLQKSKRKKVVPESTSESEEDFEGLPVKPPM